MTSPFHRSPSLRPVRSLLALILVIAGLAMSAPSASAQVTTTVSPSVLDLGAKPGATGEQEIIVQIQSTADVALQAEITPYNDLDDVPSAVEWLSLDQDQVTVAPGESATFTLQIDVPDDAEAGGHFAMVKITTGAADAADPAVGQAAVQGRFRIPVLITIGEEGDLVRSAELTRIAPVLEPDGRIGIWGELTNTGNVAISAPGDLAITDADDKDVASLEFPETTPILPGETQIIRATGTLPLPEGTEYTAAASIDVGGEDAVEAETTFTVTPAAPTGDLAVCENLDRGPTVTVDLRNPGELGLTATVSLAITNESGNQVAGANVPDTLLLWPAGDRSVATDAPTRLETGRYTLTAEITAGAGDVTTVDMAFEIGGNSPETAPLCPPPSTPDDADDTQG